MYCFSSHESFISPLWIDSLCDFPKHFLLSKSSTPIVRLSKHTTSWFTLKSYFLWQSTSTYPEVHVLPENLRCLNWRNPVRIGIVRLSRSKTIIAWTEPFEINVTEYQHHHFLVLLSSLLSTVSCMSIQLLSVVLEGSKHFISGNSTARFSLRVVAFRPQANRLSSKWTSIDPKWTR